MPRKSIRDVPAPLELDCLKVLWQMGHGSVREVRAALNQNRTLAYTTVMTVLDRLARKGGVARRRVGRSLVYTPLFTRQNLRRVAVQNLVQSLFDGSEEALLEYLRDGSSGGALPLSGTSLDPARL